MSHIATGRAESLRDEEAIHGLGISVGAMRSVARRQLAGSVVVAVLVVTVAGLTAVRFDHRDVAYLTAHGSPSVQQPIFVTPTDRVTAAINHRTEVP
jgi:hypothetical protein